MDDGKCRMKDSGCGKRPGSHGDFNSRKMGRQAGGNTVYTEFWIGSQLGFSDVLVVGEVEHHLVKMAPTKEIGQA